MLLEDYGLMKVGRDLLSDRDDIEHVQKYVLIGVSGDKVFALPYDEEEGVLCRSDEDSYTDEDWYTEDEDIDEDLNFEVDDESERQPEVVSFFIDECLFSSDDDYHNAKALRAILDEPHRVIAPE
ncbi:MAG: hypothetical protein KatS3mg082_1401 [Nitrospiraceae bacterium]|nr:MAG: hypothetical protein KatS3mg082_1401 [Nitrospiraceae bacterium]